MPDTTPPIRIIVADDQASVREGLVLMLDLLPDVTVVGSAADGRQALDLTAQLRPDAILLDLHMPVLDGVETTKLLVEQHPQVAIVVLTTYVDDASVLTALRAGALSYLTKDAGRTDIAHALHNAVAGLTVLDPGAQAVLLQAAGRAGPAGGDTTSPRPADLPDGLTRREAEILTMIARGKSNPEIAGELFLSAHTVKSHINRIFAKSGSPDRAAAIRYAREHHLT